MTKRRKLLSIIPVCTVILSMSACQTKLRNIDLDNLMNEQGLFQYADIVWGNCLEDTEKYLKKFTGEPLDFNGSVKQYSFDDLYKFNNILAKVKCEFFNDKLYEVNFIFNLQDNNEIDFEALFSDIAEILMANYGEADDEVFNNTGEALGLTLSSDFYIWYSSSETQRTILQLSKLTTNEIKKSVSLYLGDASFSSR